jgi:hypothetical protein
MHASCGEGLGETGFVEGRTWRSSSAGRTARTVASELAADLVRRQVSVFAATLPARADELIE